MSWLRKRLRRWLGIESLAQVEIEDLVHIGVDVYFKEPHMIVLYSSLGGGQIRQIPVDFNNMRELDDFVRGLKRKYRTESITWDYPRHMRNM